MQNKRQEVDEWVRKVKRFDRMNKAKQLDLDPGAQKAWSEYQKARPKGFVRMTKNQFYAKHYPVE